MKNIVRIIGGGLAGTEAAWQLARRGVAVELFEMRPQRMTEAHAGRNLGELVCSNSLRSDLLSAPAGLLKAEMRRLEQSASVLSKEDDPELPGIRFVAESQIHKVRVNLITHGFRGWALYAGTFAGKAENKAELELAERAREASSPGLPADYQPQPTGDRAAIPATQPASVR